VVHAHKSRVTIGIIQYIIISARIIVYWGLQLQFLIFFVIVHAWWFFHPAGLPGSQLIPQGMQYGLLVACFEYNSLDLLGVEYPTPLIALLHAGQVLHIEVPRDTLPHIALITDVLLQVDRQLLEH